MRDLLLPQGKEVASMRRFLLVLSVVAAMAAMLVVMSAPAMANHNDNFNNDFFGLDNNGFDNALEQESQSGDVSLGFDVSNSGNYASQCTPATQFGNTGNFQNGSSFEQFGSGTNDGFRDFGNDGFFNRGGIDDFEPGGIDVSFGGSQDVSCPSTIEQSSAASS